MEKLVLDAQCKEDDFGQLGMAKASAARPNEARLARVP